MVAKMNTKMSIPDSRDDDESSNVKQQIHHQSSGKQTKTKMTTMKKTAAVKATASSAAVFDEAKTGEDEIVQSKAVPYVVRVSFLGVAGILAKPPRNSNEGRHAESPLVPLPSNLRAVASISRSYKSKGKPSGLSNCLAKPPSLGGGGKSTSHVSRNGSVNNGEVGNNYSTAAIDQSKSFSSATSGQHSSERFVAVWNDDCKEVNQKLLNTSNTVAFEAELQLVPEDKKGENKSRLSSVGTGSFAPQTFCVTLALAPDNNDISTSIEGNPLFAIPIGLSNLTINGDETLNGKRKQLDLPLTSIFNHSFDGESFAGESPLIELPTADTAKGEPETKPKKSKSIVKRIFKKGKTSGSSIVESGRPPNAEERKSFLDRYSVDQSGDAIIRVALEVFPRGSALEKTFRQAAKLRKRKQRKKAAARIRILAAEQASASLVSTKSLSGERSEDVTQNSSALFDSDDESDASSDSDYSQSYTQMSSDEEGDSWYDDDDTFNNTVAHGKRSQAKGVLGRMFCNFGVCTNDVDMICANEEDEEFHNFFEDNIDTVASAMASMSMSDDGQGSNHDSLSAMSPEKGFSNLIVESTLACPVHHEYTPKSVKTNNDPKNATVPNSNSFSKDAVPVQAEKRGSEADNRHLPTLTIPEESQNLNNEEHEGQEFTWHRSCLISEMDMTTSSSTLGLGTYSL